MGNNRFQRVSGNLFWARNRDAQIRHIRWQALRCIITMQHGWTKYIPLGKLQGHMHDQHGVHPCDSASCSQIRSSRTRILGPFTTWKTNTRKEVHAIYKHASQRACARACVSSRAVSSYPIYCMYSAVVCKYRVLPKGPLHFNSLWILRHQPSATNKWTSHSRRPDLTQPSQDIKLLAYRLPPASTCQGDRV